jgi:hypothetical protein
VALELQSSAVVRNSFPQTSTKRFFLHTLCACLILMYDVINCIFCSCCRFIGIFSHNQLVEATKLTANLFRERELSLQKTNITFAIHQPTFMIVFSAMAMTARAAAVVADDVPSNSYRKSKNTKMLMLPSLMAASTAWIILTLHPETTYAFHPLLSNKHPSSIGTSMISITAESAAASTTGSSQWPTLTQTRRLSVTTTTTTRLWGGANDWHDRDSDSRTPWGRNKGRTDIRYFLTQRSIQSFVYLLNQCREEHTVQFLEVSCQRSMG